jgi:hypothetical protein
MNTYGKLTNIQTKEEFDIVGFDYNINYNNFLINNININNNISNYNISNYNNYININNYINNNISNCFGIYYLPKTNFNSKVLLVEFKDKEKDSFFAKVEKVVDHEDYTVVVTKYIKNNLEVMKVVEEKAC